MNLIIQYGLLGLVLGYAGSKYESHYTVWTAWISIRVRVRVSVYFILQNLAPPGTTVHVPTAHFLADDVIKMEAGNGAGYVRLWRSLTCCEGQILRE